MATAAAAIVVTAAAVVGAASATTHSEAQTAVRIIAGFDLRVKGIHIVFAVSAVGAVGVQCEAMISVVAIAPHLHALDGANAADAAEGVGATVTVRPDNVNVKMIYEVLGAEVALKAMRTVDGGELVLHLDMVIMHERVVTGHVSYAVGFEKGEKELHVTGIAIRSMAGV